VIELYTLMEKRGGDKGQPQSVHRGEYPVQESYGLGGEYPAPPKQGKVVEISVQAIILGGEYPTRRKP
jgi:hypothetical protein